MSRKLTNLLIAACLTLAAVSSVYASHPAIRLIGYSPQQVHDLELETQRAMPLNVIGLGQPVYLESELEGTYSWSLTGPSGSAATLSATTDRQVWFKPDVKGEYTVTLDFVGADSSATLTKTITGATYAGISKCSACHNGVVTADKVTGWKTTGHSTMLQRGLDGVLSSHYGEGCIECHTTGYDSDSLAVNGGFDDVAVTEGWTFPDSLFVGVYQVLVDSFPATANLANIQCESCHGPGSEHSGSSSTIAVSYDAGVCAYCHDEEPYHTYPAQWANSAHGNRLDPDEHFIGSTSCVGCHTAEGFFQQNVDQDSVTADYDTPHGQTCQVCHDPHEQTVEHQLRIASDMSYLDDNGDPKYSTTGEPTQACTVCHHFRNGRDYPGEVPHHSHQTEMLNGTAGWMNPDKTMPASNPHGELIEERCVSCHMAEASSADRANYIGSHTFAVHAVADSANGLAEDLYLTEACVGCHSSIGNDFDIDGVQTKVSLMLNELFDRLPKATSGRLAGYPAYDSTSLKDGLITEDQLTASFNWYIVEYDGSKGVHNPGMSQALLEDALDRVPATAACTSLDINADGKLGIADAVTLILKGAEDNTQACIDRNGDYKYDLTDVIKLLGDIWGGSTMLAGNIELVNFQMDLTADQIRYVQSVIDQLNLTEEQAAAFQIALNGDGSGVSSLPKAFSLAQNAPNPFNPSTTIQFAVPEGKARMVSLKVYDVRGRMVRSLVEATKDAGTYTVFWDGTNENGQKVSSGVYFYRMTAGDFTQTRKMVMLK